MNEAGFANISRSGHCSVNPKRIWAGIFQYTLTDLFQNCARYILNISRQMVNLKGSILSSCEEKYFKMCIPEEPELKEELGHILAKF